MGWNEVNFVEWVAWSGDGWNTIYQSVSQSVSQFN